MPNKQTRTQVNRKTRGRNGGSKAVVGPVWPAGGSATELKTLFLTGGNYQLYHNVAVAMYNTSNLIDNISIGPSFGQRIGNRVFIKRLRAHIVFNNKTDRPNVSYRVCATAAPTNTNTDSYIELFAGGVFSGLHQPQNSLLLYDTVFPLNQGSGMDNNVTPNKERSFNHWIDIPINKPAVFSNADGKCSTNLTVWFCAYDAFGTLTSDNIASVAQLTWALDYTDS